MSELDKLLAANAKNRYVAQPLSFTKQPRGWEPGVVWKDNKGTLVSKPMDDGEHEHSELLTEWGFDPSTHAIRSLSFRTWEAQIGEGETKWMRSYKADIERSIDAVEMVDVEELRSYIRSYKPPKNVQSVPKGRTPAPDAFCVFLSDFQIGKGEGGGSRRTIERLTALIGLVQERIRELRMGGRPLGELYVFGLGDLVEGCSGQYAQQEFTIDMNRRQQINIVTDLLLEMIKTWAPMFKRVVITCVGGNHGENRKNGKSFTDDGDNDDVLVFENLARVFAEVPAYSHVSFVIPEDDLVVVLDVAGVNVGITHGHIMRAGGGKLAQGKAAEWWKGQMFGWQPIAMARIMAFAHFHNGSFAQHGERTAFCLPALDNGSKWFRDMKGEDGPAGLVTMRIAAHLPWGWSDYQILSPEVSNVPFSNRPEIDEELEDSLL
jgi:hypothetical protein